MNECIKLSIIVPVYNLESYIERCIKSILSQTHKNLEIIIVDDGSTDNSKNVINEISKLDKRIILVCKNNGGVTSARIAGIGYATGDWIGFVDGDDEIESDMYDLLLNNAVKYSAEISHCGYQMIFLDGRKKFFYNTGRMIKQNKLRGLKDLLDGSIVEPGLCNKIFKKDLVLKTLKKHVIDTNIKINEDLLLNFFLFSQSNFSIFNDVCKYHYIVRENSASRAKLSKNRIFDPIRVKKIILNNSFGEIKEDVEKSLISTVIYTYCTIVVSKQSLIEEKKYLRTILKKYQKNLKILPFKLRLLSFLINKSPKLFEVVYRFYSKWLQKKKYE